MPPLQDSGIISDTQADPIDPSVDVLVLFFETEGDLLTLDYAVARQNDTDHVRTWEIPGAPHVGGGAPPGHVLGRQPPAGPGVFRPAFRARKLRRLDLVVADVIKVDVHTKSWELGDVDVALVVHRVDTDVQPWRSGIVVN